MNREEFLKKHWRRYPPAKPGWIDVAAWLDEGKTGAVVCGRIGPAGSLEWNGRTFLADMTSASGLEQQGCDFSPSLLSEGDLVAARVAGSEKNRVRLDRVLLLAPGRWRQPREFTVERSQDWMIFLAGVREHFISRGFTEASTPTLVPSPGTEPFLDPFVTSWEIGSSKSTFYLPTSPEFHLKKMLAGGWSKIFEIKTCFRNGEISEHHQPEFQMLEWYRAFCSLEEIAKDVASLLAHCCEQFEMAAPKIERISMAQAFADVFPGFVLRADADEKELLALAQESSIGVSDDDDFDDLFHRLFLERVEPWLAKKEVVILRGYPPSQAALSRIGEDGFADRFEVYWRGVELANAFHELNDPVENEKRFAEDARKKTALGKPAVPRDEALVEAIRDGLPPSGGIALGLDRLFMALVGAHDIADVRAFPVRD